MPQETTLTDTAISWYAHIMGNIVDRLKQAITDSGESYARIERECGVNRLSVGRFITGKTSLSLDQAERLAAYFGLELTPKTNTDTGGK